MGIPIKDRGIQWKESYTEKSQYLKEEFDSQIGPGAYFRWEGHDHVTGADYYAVVTPGFSKKHGYHFFAALRKMPADNGASGKKFKTQAEALSYAMDTWRVPPPDEPLHQAYIDTDLVGKPIVTENVHASQEIEMVKTAEEEMATIIISEGPAGPSGPSGPSEDLEKTAMSLPITGALGRVFPVRGTKSNVPNQRFAAVAWSLMGLGAGLGMNKQWGLIDLVNQGDEEVFDPQAGRTTDAKHPKLSTCEAPTDAAFHNNINVLGYWKLHKLYNIDSKTNVLTEKQPAYDPTQRHEGYRIVRFSENDVVPVTINVSAKKLAQFRAVLNAINGSTPSRALTNRNGTPALDEQGQPIMGHQAVNIRGEPVWMRDGKPKVLRDSAGNALGRMDSRFIRGERGRLRTGEIQAPPEGSKEDYTLDARIPIDVFWKFKDAIRTTASTKELNFKYANVTKLYKYWDSKGEIRTQADFDRVQNTPIFEAFDLRAGTTIAYDNAGFPMCIKITTDPRINMESFSEGGQRPEAVQYQFREGVVEDMLRRPEINGDLMKLRWALAKNRIPLTANMFADVRTCPPKLYRIRSVLDRLDANGIPQLTDDGRLVKERTDLTPEFSISAHRGKVRQWDTRTNRYNLVNLPRGVDQTQRFRGCHAIVEHAKQYVPVMKPNALGEMEEQLHEIDAGEVKIYDTESPNVLCVGNHYTIMAKAAKLSSKRSDVRDIHELGQVRIGIYAGYKETYATKKYVKGAPTNRNRTIVALRMADGRILSHPENPLDDPQNEAVQIVDQALGDPEVAASIEGYYYVHQRQHQGKPLTTAKPSANKEITIDRMTRSQDGSLVAATAPNGQPLPPLRITLNDAYSGTAGQPTYFKSMRMLIEYLKAKLAFTDVDIGWWTDANIDTYRHVDEMQALVAKKLKEVADGTMPEDSLEEWERLYGEFDLKRDVTPAAFLRRLAQVNPNNQADFMPKRGSLFRILRRDGEPATTETFVVRQDADDFARQLQEQNGETYTVTEERDVELVARDASRVGQPLVENIDIEALAAAFDAFGQGEELSPEEAAQAELEQSEEVGDEEIPADPEEEPERDRREATEGEQAEAEPTEEAPAAEVPATPAPAAPPAAAAPTAPAPGKPISTKQEEPAPAPAPAAPKADDLDEDIMLPPKPKWKAKRPSVPPPVSTKPDQEASAVQRLIKLADALDSQGRVEEANAVDRLLKITLEKMKK